MLIKYCHANQNNPTHTAKFSNTPPHKKELSLKAKCPLTFTPKTCIHKHYVSQRKSTHTQKNSLSLPVRCTKKPLAHKNAHKTKLTFKPVTHTTKPISLTKNISHNSINHSHQKLAPHQKTPTPTNKHMSLSLSLSPKFPRQKTPPVPKNATLICTRKPLNQTKTTRFQKISHAPKNSYSSKKKKKKDLGERPCIVLFVQLSKFGVFLVKKRTFFDGCFFGGGE